MKLKIKAGTTSRLDRVFIQDTSKSDGSGLTGLTYQSSGLAWAYIRNGSATASTITLANAAIGTWTSGGFVEVDATNLPGVYEIGLPNAMIATGSVGVISMLRGASNMAVLPMQIELDAIDYQDSQRAGLASLPNANPAAAGGLLTVGSGSGQLNPASGQVDLINAPNATATAAIATAVNTQANAIEGAYTPAQAIQWILAAVAGQLSGASGTSITIKNPAGGTTRITATVDSNGNRTAVTLA